MSNKSLSIGYSSPLFEDTNQTVYNQVLLLSKSFMIDKGNNSIFVKLFKQTGLDLQKYCVHLHLWKPLSSEVPEMTVGLFIVSFV